MYKLYKYNCQEIVEEGVYPSFYSHHQPTIAKCYLYTKHGCLLFGQGTIMLHMACIRCFTKEDVANPPYYKTPLWIDTI